MDWNKAVKEALDRTEFMALSTVGKEGCWTNPVAFAYGEKAELFFISMMKSKHTHNILNNKQVSAAIFKTERFPKGDVVGLQLAGEATHLTDTTDIERAAKYYFGRSPSNDEFRSETSVVAGEQAVWQFFAVVPTELWLFDSRVFGEDRERVDLQTLHLNLS